MARGVRGLTLPHVPAHGHLRSPRRHHPRACDRPPSQAAIPLARPRLRRVSPTGASTRTPRPAVDSSRGGRRSAPPPLVGLEAAAVYCRGSAPPATGDTCPEWLTSSLTTTAAPPFRAAGSTTSRSRPFLRVAPAPTSTGHRPRAALTPATATAPRCDRAVRRPCNHRPAAGSPPLPRPDEVGNVARTSRHERARPSRPGPRRLNRWR